MSKFEESPEEVEIEEVEEVAEAPEELEEVYVRVTLTWKQTGSLRAAVSSFVDDELSPRQEQLLAEALEGQNSVTGRVVTYVGLSPVMSAESPGRILKEETADKAAEIFRNEFENDADSSEWLRSGVSYEDGMQGRAEANVSMQTSDGRPLDLDLVFEGVLISSDAIEVSSCKGELLEELPAGAPGHCVAVHPVDGASLGEPYLMQAGQDGSRSVFVDNGPGRSDLPAVSLDLFDLS